MLRTTKRILQPPFAQAKSVLATFGDGALDKLCSDFEEGFKVQHSRHARMDGSKFLPAYCQHVADVVPYITLIMKVFADTKQLENMSFLFTLAIEEVEEVPEELFRIYFLSLCRFDTFNKDELVNLLDFSKCFNVQLSFVSLLCVVELALRLGLDPSVYIRAAAMTPPDHTPLTKHKLSDLLSALILTHSDSSSITALMDVCARHNVQGSTRQMDHLFRLASNNSSVPARHLSDLLAAVTSSPTAKDIPQYNVIRCIARCIRCKDILSLVSVQKSLVAANLLEGDTNAPIRTALSVARVAIVAECGVFSEAFEELERPTLSAEQVSMSPHSLVVEGVELLTTSLGAKLAAGIGRQGVEVVDACFYHLEGLKDRGVPITTRSLDVVVAACAEAKDAARAKDTINAYTRFDVMPTPTTFLCYLRALPVTKAVIQHKQVVAEMLSLGIEPSFDLIQGMLGQCLEASDIDAAMWVVGINASFNIPVDRHYANQLMVRLASMADRTGCANLLGVLKDTHSIIDDRYTEKLTSQLALMGVTL